MPWGSRAKPCCLPWRTSCCLKNNSWQATGPWKSWQAYWSYSCSFPDVPLPCYDWQLGPLGLMFCRSDRIQLKMGRSRCMVTWYFMVRLFFFLCQVPWSQHPLVIPHSTTLRAAGLTQCWISLLKTERKYHPRSNTFTEGDTSSKTQHRHWMKYHYIALCPQQKECTGLGTMRLK